MIRSIQQQPLTALVVEGGAMRSVFSAGVLDGFLRRDFNPFDFYIGVSGGAGNLLAYLTGQAGRSLELYRAVARHKQFINYRRFVTGGNLMDIDWLVRFIFDSNAPAADIPLPPMRPFFIATTDVSTGEASYIRATPDNLPAALTATMSLPLVNRTFPMIDGNTKTDGGVAANIPADEAIRRGATRILVIRSRHRDYIKRDTLFHRYIRHKLRRHTALVRKMAQRVQLHDQAIALLRTPPPGVDILEVCPPEHFSAGRFTRRLSELQQGYEAGLTAAGDTIAQWQTVTD